MATITKEQVEDALKGLWITSESCNKDEHDDTVRGYISQLEADNSELNKSLCQAVNAHQVYMDENPKRQPVSESPQGGLRSNPQNVDSEKLRDAVSRIDDEFCSATEFNRELCENDWAIIANALSELETLRDALVKWDSASTNLGQASNLDEWIVLLLEARRQGKEALGDKT